MNSKRLQQQIHFLVETDKLKEVIRKTFLIDGSRYETVAEHSWHITLMAVLFLEYALPAVNIERVIKMTLIHDLVEIYTGDTFAFDNYDKKQVEDKEKDAAEKLFSLLPTDQSKEFLELWCEFENMTTTASIYANAIDRLQPFINEYYLNNRNGKVNNISQEQLVARMSVLKEGTPILWSVIQAMIVDLFK